MKFSQLFFALIAAGALALGAYAADPAPKAPRGKKAGCCVKAEKNGTTCDHACCVEAAKEHKNCEKCGGTNGKKKPA